MNRLYTNLLTDHFARNDQAAFLLGPRQVGKTTVSKQLLQTRTYAKYLNWDNIDTRERILQGPYAALEGLPLQAVLPEKPMAVFDELHKYREWKPFLKGIIDEYKSHLDLIVTGSAQLDLIRKSGESLMGRYFLYHVHPLSVGEMIHPQPTLQRIQTPLPISDDLFENLWRFGGFPEPFLRAEERFFNQWQNLRQTQLIHEDIRSLAQVHELSLLEMLAHLLKQQTGQLLNYSTLSKKVRVSDQTIRRWIRVLESFYYCFTLTPWHQNVARSLLKEPKVYLWDWSVIEDKGQRLENFVASHLLKAIHFWNDSGLGLFSLHFLRTKEQKEVDFLVAHQHKPWMLVEVKSSFKASLSPALNTFHQTLGTEHAFQLAADLPYVEQDCFTSRKPVIVSLKTFLSQLV